MRFGTFDGSQTSYQVSTVNFEAMLNGNITTLKIDGALAIPKLSIAHRKVNWSVSTKIYPHLVEIEIPEVDLSLVTVLIRQDVTEVHETLDIRTPQQGCQGPIAI